MGFFHNIKDKAVSFAGKKILATKLERYGVMLDLRIDSDNKNIFLSVLLKGEKEPVEAQVVKYSFEKVGDDDFIVLHKVEVSREWMNLLAADLLKDKKFKLPEGMASAIIKMVM